MKGVLVGVDFITQTDGTVKLLEVNTGVQFANDISYLEHQKLVDLAVENNLTGVTIVDKPTVNLVERYNDLSASCATAGIAFEHIEVAESAITVPNVENEADKLVVRIAFDTNAVVDYNYARDNYEFIKLFDTYGSGSSVVNTFHSSSDGSYNNLEVINNEISGSTLPNIIVKKRYPDAWKEDFPHFYAVNTEEELTAIKEEYTGDDVIVNNYIIDKNNIVEDKLGSQIRKWYLLYGSTLTALPLGGYRYTNEAPMKLPLDFVEGTNQVEKHEKKALTSNASTLYYTGVPSDSYVDKIVDSETVNVLASEVQVGDEVKTVVIPGVTLENDTDYITEGLGFPSGAFYSSSVVISKNEKVINDHLLNITVSGSENTDILLAPQERIFTFSTTDNLTKFRKAKDIVVGDTIITNLTDSVEVTEIEYTYYTGSYTTLDVEEVDAFIGGPTVNMNIFIHNCFVAGTEITLANGDVKNIEDVAIGEEVLTYNVDKKETERGIIGDLKKHKVDSVIRLTLDNENIIVTTAEHPFYVIDKGWVKAGELQPLDICLKEDGKESLISTTEVLEEKHEVYNLLNVSENHNFYANKILVHNKKQY